VVETAPRPAACFYKQTTPHLRVEERAAARRRHLNRLSDLLFILSRAADADAGVEEPL
jgi:cob(I)alamin adenosyltransferase